MKKNILFFCLLFIHFNLFGWYSRYYFYSDFQWINGNQLLAMRTDNATGAGYTFHDLIVVDTSSKSILPITPMIKGVTFSLTEKKIFIHTNRDIVLYDVSSPGKIKVIPLYNLKGNSESYIDKLNWVTGSLLSFFIRTPDQKEMKILFDYKKKKAVATEIIDTKLAASNISFEVELEHGEYQREYIQAIRLSTNTNVIYAEEHLNKLRKKYPVYLSEKSGKYKIYMGPYTEKDAKQQLLKIKREGYKDAYLEEIVLYHVHETKDNTEWYLSGTNIWKKNKREYLPVFKKAAPLEGAIIFDDMLYFIRDQRLYALNLLTDELSPLTINLGVRDANLESLPFAVYDNHQGIFIVKTGSGELYRLDKGGIISGSIQARYLVSPFSALEDDPLHYPNLLQLVEAKHKNIKKKGLSPEFTLELKGEGKVLVINFFFWTNGGTWLNSGHISSENGDFVVLEAVTNL